MNRKIMRVLKALLVSYIVTVILLVILAFLLYKFEIGEQIEVKVKSFEKDEKRINDKNNYDNSYFINSSRNSICRIWNI